MVQKIITNITGNLLILLFGYAAVSKLLVYPKFVSQIGQSPVLQGMSPYIAWVIPAIELGICMLLILPKWKLTGFYAATGLMLVFTIYVLVIMYLSPIVPCSCGGILNGLGWKSHLVFNILFTGIACTGLLVEKRQAGNTYQQNVLV